MKCMIVKIVVALRGQSGHILQCLISDFPPKTCTGDSFLSFKPYYVNLKISSYY